jgi:UDP-N-acetylmuramoyl-L-alanyl-D-glutamate--2,6-diaminopimelate ligase
MQLEYLLAAVDHVAFAGDETVDVTAIDYDSRRVVPGSLFCCLVGANSDGHLFADDAVSNGAVAILAERRLAVDVPQAIVRDSRSAMAWAATTLNGNPSADVEVIGVTGTNGKTTVTHLLENIITEAGRKARVLGTLSGTRTTPEAPEMQKQLATWRDEGVDVVAVEVSSHALSLHRIDGTHLRVAVFTNLTRDHLDFHHSMEAYFEAKARLFDPSMTDSAVVNVDNPYGRLLLDAAKVPTVGYSLGDVRNLVLTTQGSRFEWRDLSVELPLAGSFNVANAVAAAEAATVVGVEPEAVARGLSRPLVVPGRFEVVDAGQPFTVVVDYAHTPDGLEQLLAAARELPGSHRVTVVFGCGGDRDESKRAPMGEVAAQLADRVVLTADNSRSEDTGVILDEVRLGFERTRPRRATELIVEPDRRAAIGLALRAAGTGDVVLVAGKGHERTITIGDRVEPFDDRQVVREELHRINGGCR